MEREHKEPGVKSSLTYECPGRGWWRTSYPLVVVAIASKWVKTNTKELGLFVPFHSSSISPSRSVRVRLFLTLLNRRQKANRRNVFDSQCNADSILQRLLFHGMLSFSELHAHRESVRTSGEREPRTGINRMESALVSAAKSARR